MTVKEVLGVLSGPESKLTVTIAYESEEYDVTGDTPVRDTFADYVVDCVTCPSPFEYHIFLKQEYVKKGAQV